MQVFSSIADLSLINALRLGAVGILPTDTIYGLTARAQDPKAVAKLYHVKHREGKPGTIIAADAEQLLELGLDPQCVHKVVDLWPSPLSIVLPSPPGLSYLDQGLHSLAVRIPANELLRVLLFQTGPLLTSSANLPGQPPATSLDEAQAYFGESIDFYATDKRMGQGSPSTVARLDDDGALIVLRQGAAQLLTGAPQVTNDS